MPIPCVGPCVAVWLEVGEPCGAAACEHSLCDGIWAPCVGATYCRDLLGGTFRDSPNYSRILIISG